jgi:hypothetical protein
MRTVRLGGCRAIGLAAMVAVAGCGSVELPGDPGEPGPGDPGDPGGPVSPGRDPLPGDFGIIGRAGVDFSWDRPSPAGLHADGYTFAVRYLSYSTTGKNLTVDEASALIAANMDIAAVWETGATDALDGNARGASDAAEALRQATAVGMPDGRPIYFAIDFDATADQLAAIDDYFAGVASVLGVARTGAYGGIHPLQHLLDAGAISWAWQTTAWSAGQWEPRAQLRQVHNDISVAGGACDLDEAEVSDFGQWGAATP